MWAQYERQPEYAYCSSVSAAAASKQSPFGRFVIRWNNLTGLYFFTVFDAGDLLPVWVFMTEPNPKMNTWLLSKCFGGGSMCVQMYDYVNLSVCVCVCPVLSVGV